MKSYDINWFQNLYKRSLQFLLTFIIIIATWQMVILFVQPPKYILPSPLQVFYSIIRNYEVLLENSKVTLVELLFGLLLGIFWGISIALILIISKTINRWLLPILIVIQALPSFALAPILVLWIGYGMASKIVMAAIIIFFPVTICCYNGLNNTPKGYIQLAKTLGLSEWKILIRIKLPASLSEFAGGVKMAVIYAPSSVIIGEWVGSSSGLGYYMMQTNARMQIENMYASLFIISLISIILYLLTDMLFKLIIVWPAND